jgi:hypothetical protein
MSLNNTRVSSGLEAAEVLQVTILSPLRLRKLGLRVEATSQLLCAYLDDRTNPDACAHLSDPHRVPP